MKVVIQRVLNAEVTIRGESISKIGEGLLLLVGIANEDTQEDVEYMADKVINLRIFDDSSGKMNLSIKDIDGEILAVSQFTLLADTKKGRRPSFTDAAPSEKASILFERFASALMKRGVPVKKGVFGESMKVSLVNNGPVTIIIESIR